MPFAYIAYPKYRLVISTGSGCVTWYEIKARQDQTKTDPDFNPEFNQIVDLSGVTSFDMDSAHSSALAQRMIFSTSSKRAFVAPAPVTFGMARMWEIFTEMSDNPSQIRVFNDLASALKWLDLESLPL